MVLGMHPVVSYLRRSLSPPHERSVGRRGRNRTTPDSTLSGRVKTGHLWTPQIRPFPAPETSVDLYLTASCVRKLVWSLVRQLRGPHLRMWA